MATDAANLPDGENGAAEVAAVNTPRQNLVNQVLADRYDILETIGEGSLLAAYRARDRALNRIVALKTILPRYADRRDVRERLRAGLGQVLSLSHPTIVRAYDVGEDTAPDGANLLFVVEEYVRGIDLKERIRRAAPFQLAAAVDTAVAIAEALEYAHARGVIHGDVRPQNVLVGPENQVKLTGFGGADAQALVIGDDMVSLKRVVPYIAPDAARAAAPTASGDLYALGVTLFELLTGELPYKGDSALAVALKHVQDPIPAPRSVNTGVPRALDGIVQRAMGKRPEERYPSATEFLFDLRAVRDALRYGRPLSWSPLDRVPAAAAAVSPLLPEIAPDEATVAPAPVTPVTSASVIPALLPAPSPEETLVMPILSPTVATPPTRRVAAPLPTAAAVGADSPYVNSVTGTVATAVPKSVPPEEERPEPVTPNTRDTRDTRGSDDSRGSARTRSSGSGNGGGGSRWLLSLNLFLFLLALGGIGGLVWLTFYSLTPASEVVVPNLVQRSLTEAKQLALEQHFDLSVVDEQFRDTEPSGVIYQMNPAPGRHIRAGKSVSVWVSKGPRMVDVPDVRSMSFDKARHVIEKNNLRVGDYTFEYDSLEAKGNVIRQAPAPGESRARGFRIDLVLSKGEEPPPTPLPDLPPPPDINVAPTPAPDVPADGGNGDATPKPVDSDTAAADSRLRTFDIKYHVPSDGMAHRVRLDVTDRDGTRTVYDETRKAGDSLKQTIEAVGRSIRVRLYDNDQMVSDRSM